MLNIDIIPTKISKFSDTIEINSKAVEVYVVLKICKLKTLI